MVIVSDVGGDEKIPIPVNSDDLLPLQRLDRYFPGVAGLYFIENEVKIPVNFDQNDTHLIPPANGWDSAQYYVVRTQSRQHTQIDSRPGASFDIAPDSPYSAAPRSPAPLSKSIDQWMFFSHDDAGKSCVICIHPQYFVTFRHGTHMKLNVGDTLQIYKAKSDTDQMFNTVVVQILDEHDFILLKSEEDVIEKGPRLVPPEESENFLLAGFDNLDQDLSYLTGIVHVKDFHFRGPNSVLGPFILGTAASSPGDSGGACWNSRGLIGMSLGCTTMPTAPHHSAISDAAIFSPKNYMISSCYLNNALKREIFKERSKSSTPSPPKKKFCLMTTIEGIGTGELSPN